MKTISLVIIFSVLTSCSLFQLNRKLEDVIIASKHVCLSSAGKGRLEFSGKKYVFSYESALDEEMGKWLLVLSFPLHASETFEIDWSNPKKIIFNTSIEEKLLKENNEINPEQLHRFVNGLGHTLGEVIAIRQEDEPIYNEWSLDKNVLSSKGIKYQEITSKFYNHDSQGYFGVMSISYNGTDGQSYKIDLVVRNCFETLEKQLN